MTDSGTEADSIQEITNEYLESLDQEVDQEKKEELQEEIVEYEERYSDLVEEHGEEHNLAKRAKEVVDHRREQLQELESAEDQIDTIRQRLLQKTAAEFELDSPWLPSNVSEAITHALYSEKDGRFMLFGEEIRSEEDLEQVDDFERIERAEVVILLAKDRLGESDRVEAQYDRLEGGSSFTAFEALVEHGDLTPSELADIVGEDKGTVNNWLKNPINRWDKLIPFYRPEQGKYGLSTTGRYFAEHYFGGDVKSVIGSGPQDESEDGEGDTESQTTLEATASSQERTDDTGSSTNDAPSTSPNVDEIDDTEEKAEAMFSEVSDRNGS